MTAWDTAVAALGPASWLKLNGDLSDTGSAGYIVTPGAIASDLFYRDYGPFPDRVSVTTSWSPTIAAPSALSYYSCFVFLRFNGWSSPENTLFLSCADSSSSSARILGSEDNLTLAFDDPAWNETLTSLSGVDFTDGRWHFLGFSVSAGTVDVFFDAENILHTVMSSPSIALGRVLTWLARGWDYADVLFFDKALSGVDVSAMYAGAVSTGIQKVIPDYNWEHSRMALDVDGTIITARINSGEERELDQSMKSILVSPDYSVVAFLAEVSKPRLSLLFPEPRDLYSFFLSGALGSSTGVTDLVDHVLYDYYTTFDYSVDTTDGINGTWVRGNFPFGRGFSVTTSYGRALSDVYATRLFYTGLAGTTQNVGPDAYVDGRLMYPGDGARTGSMGIVFCRMDRAVDNRQVGMFVPPMYSVRGLRIYPYSVHPRIGYINPGFYSSSWTANFQLLHLYGEKSSIRSNVEYSLAILAVDSVDEVPLTSSRYGKVAVRESSDFLFRVENRSTRYSCSDIDVCADVLLDNPGYSFLEQILFASEEDGFTTFKKHVRIAGLAPGERSSPVMARRVTPHSATPGIFLPRVVARAGVWR